MKVTLGYWVCPSGNSCDVSFERDASHVGHLWFAWDAPPPLTRDDAAHYLAVILPAVLASVEALGLLTRSSWSFRRGGVA